MEERRLIERLARHLAAGKPDDWPEKLDEASSILALLKDPDAAMREVGDGAGWRAMIDAALRERWDLLEIAPTAGKPEPGADEEGETPLHRHAVSDSRANWVHVPDGKEKRA